MTNDIDTESQDLLLELQKEGTCAGVFDSSLIEHSDRKSNEEAEAANADV